MSTNQNVSSVHGNDRTVWLAILAMPLLFSCLGLWQVWRGATAGVAEADLLVARLRQVMAWLTVLAGVTAGAAGSGGMLLVSRSARRSRRSRPELAAAFGKVSRILPAALALQVVGTVLALFAAVTFEAGALWFVPEPDDRTVLLAILALLWTGVALWGAAATLRDLRRALRSFVPAPFAVWALPISRVQAPGLFALLRDLAHERGTTLPELVAVGPEAGFFVTALPVLLGSPPGTAPTAAGCRTLYIPLAEMATLDLDELRTVLAHELAHFSGEDTEYSRRFQPLYAGLGQGARAMSLRRIDWGGTRVDRLFERAVHPHTALAVHAFTQFGYVVAHWARLRELEADRAAVASGSPAALATSLLRLGLTAELLRVEAGRIAEQPGMAPPDLAAALIARLGTEGAGDPAAHLDDQVPHPTDAHPPTRQRIEAAGVTIGPALLERASRPVDPADLAAVQALFADWAALSGGIGRPLWDHALQRQEERRSRLQEAAAAMPARMETALHASLLRPVTGLVLLGLFCLATSVGCVLAALYGGTQDQAAWRLLFGIGAAGALGLGFAALWGFRLWRGRKMPFLVLTEEGVRSPGFVGTVRWLDVDGIGVSALRSPTAWFVLRPEAPLPQRTGLIRRLRIDTRTHAVQFMGLSPRGLNEAAFRTLLLRHAQAAHARAKLEAASPATDWTSGDEA